MFEFEKGKKHKCPNCGQKTFVRLIDKKTGQLLDERYGKCDRYDKCGYKYYPKSMDKATIDYLKCMIKLHEEFCDKDFTVNNLHRNLCEIFGKDKVDKVFNLYKVLNIKYLKSKNPYRNRYSNAIAFPFISKLEPLQISYTQIIKYKGLKRDKEISPMSIVALAKLEYKDTEKYNAYANFFEDYDKKEVKRDCAFGMHIFEKHHDQINTVFIVEAPKTAIIATMYYGDYEQSKCIFLALGGATLINETILKKLAIKNICLIPDCGLNEEIKRKWLNMLNFNNNTKSSVIMFELDGEDGYDLADAILDGKAPDLPFIKNPSKPKPKHDENQAITKQTAPPKIEPKPTKPLEPSQPKEPQKPTIPITQTSVSEQMTKIYFYLDALKCHNKLIEGVWLKDGTFVFDALEFYNEIAHEITRLNDEDAYKKISLLREFCDYQMTQ